MAEIIHQYEYLIAWCVYVLAGLGCSVVWWKMTSFLRHHGWRDLVRGIVVVLMMDLLLEGAKGGLQGGLVLLFSLFAMLIGLTLRLLFWRRTETP